MNTPQNRFVDIYQNQQKIVLRNDSNSTSVVITNNGTTITRTPYDHNHLNGKSTSIRIYAVYGIVPLYTQSYLIVVTDAVLKADLAGKLIFAAKKFQWLPIRDPLSKVKQEDKPYIDMFNVWFNTGYFFFSYEMDLTNTLQQNFEKSSLGSSKVNHPCRSVYFYNECYMTQFIKDNINDWIQPFICGFVHSKTCMVNNKYLTLTLLSRRDKSRGGLRFLSRGSDDKGNCTNFVETEQIFCVNIESGYRFFSHLQVRGSIPFLWKQTPNLKWAPSVKIEVNPQKNVAAYSAHAKSMLKNYDETTFVNLIDKKSWQLQLGNKLDELHKQVPHPKIHLVWFDFHNECKKMQYQNLSKLVGQINEQLESNHYYEATVQNTNIGQVNVAAMKQSGVIRTNCVDCLDRTNVVQSVIGRN